jgi:hypothetical protein
MPKDMEQARRMLNMRIKVDMWSKSLDENFREGIRENVRDLFCQLPVRRVWFYLKLIRHMRLDSGNVGGLENSGFDGGNSPDEPEDVIAKGRILHHLPMKTLH